jgi:hypothetical protein
MDGRSQRGQSFARAGLGLRQAPERDFAIRHIRTKRNMHIILISR